VLERGKNKFRPEAFLTAYPVPYESRELILFR